MTIKNRESQNVSRWLGDLPGAPTPERLTRALDVFYQPPAPDIIQTAQSQLRYTLRQQKPERIRYDSFSDKHLGRVFFAATRAGLVAVAFGRSEQDFRDEIRRQLRAEAVRASGELDTIRQQLQEYLGGRRTEFDLPLDLSLLTDFQRRVLLTALKVPRGQTATYGDIARRIGRPKAARAVGQALRRNPIPIVLPCHRILGSDGSLRGYASSRGTKTKAWLLELEGVRLSAA